MSYVTIHELIQLELPSDKSSIHKILKSYMYSLLLRDYFVMSRLRENYRMYDRSKSVRRGD